MTTEKQIEEALRARLQALDLKRVEEVVAFYTADGAAVVSGDINPHGRFRGTRELTRFYRDLFSRLPAVRREAENVVISASASEAVALYDIRVTLGPGPDGQLRGLVTVADLWRRVGDEWHLAHHIGRMARPEGPEHGGEGP